MSSLTSFDELLLACCSCVSRQGSARSRLCHGGWRSRSMSWSIRHELKEWMNHTRFWITSLFQSCLWVQPPIIHRLTVIHERDLTENYFSPLIFFDWCEEKQTRTTQHPTNWRRGTSWYLTKQPDHNYKQRSYSRFNWIPTNSSNNVGQQK